MKTPATKQIVTDPLLEIVERHLFRAGSDEQPTHQMIEAVVVDYLLHLDGQGAHVPSPVRQIFVDDLKEEIREMVVKKTCGGVRIDSGSGAVSATPANPRKLA
jgi:hypothetical protein